MKLLRYFLSVVVIVLLAVSIKAGISNKYIDVSSRETFETNSSIADDPVTLAIGSKAPDFKLPGVDGKTYSLASFSKSKLLVIIFTCNHCPTAQAYEDRMIQLTKEYTPKGVAFLAISPNDPDAVRLDELGYSDMGDTFDEMKLRSKQKKYNFP